jgi:hypothetical protein
MYTRLPRFLTLVVFAAVMAVGASSFVVPVGACGGSQSNGSCKDAAPPALDWLARVRAIAATIDALIP